MHHRSFGLSVTWHAPNKAHLGQNRSGAFVLLKHLEVWENFEDFVVHSSVHIGIPSGPTTFNLKGPTIVDSPCYSIGSCHNWLSNGRYSNFTLVLAWTGIVGCSGNWKNLQIECGRPTGNPCSRIAFYTCLKSPPQRTSEKQQEKCMAIVTTPTALNLCVKVKHLLLLSARDYSIMLHHQKWSGRDSGWESPQWSEKIHQH